MENSTTNDGGRNGSIQQQQEYYPRRPQAKNCLFFVITGSCRYGQNCRFNHPAQTDAAAVENHHEGRNQTVYCKSTRTIPCKFYSAGICKYGPFCRYYHPSVPVAVPDPAVVQYNSDGLPMRVGVPVCSFYMNTEWCGYGAVCKFHHPELKQIGSTDHQGYAPAEAHPYAGSTATGFSWY